MLGGCDTYILDDAAGNSDELSPRFTWHGFQYVLVNPSPGVRFSGELDALTAHWTTANVAETATIEFGGDGAEMLASIRDIARASQISNVAAYLPTDCPTRCVRHDIIVSCWKALSLLGCMQGEARLVRG